MLDFSAMEPAVRGKRFFAEWAAPVGALLLLFMLVAPPEVAYCLGGTPDNLSVCGGMGEDHSPGLPRKYRVSERIFGLPGLDSVGRVASGIYRGAQPKSDGFATLKAMGIRTVITLRTHHGEKEAVEAAGMQYVEIPMSFWKTIDPAAVRKALSVITDPANRPVFIHCSRGVDRTGVVMAVYRMEVEGWGESEAEAEMEAFGFHHVWFQLKNFVRQYKKVRKEVRGWNGP
jgi:tyrosine-protein phosphatase SIW14